MAGQFVEGIVLDDAAARQVLASRLGLAPAGERLEATQYRRVAAR